MGQTKQILLPSTKKRSQVNKLKNLQANLITNKLNQLIIQESNKKIKNHNKSHFKRSIINEKIDSMRSELPSNLDQISSNIVDTNAIMNEVLSNNDEHLQTLNDQHVLNSNGIQHLGKVNYIGKIFINK